MALLPLIAGLPDTDPGSGGGSGGGSGDVTSAGDNTFTGTNIFPDGKLRVQITDPSLGLTAPTQFASYTQDSLVVNEMSNPQVGTEVLSFPREIWKTNGIAMDSALSTGFVGDLGILGELATITIDSISVASPAVFTTAAAHGFTVGQIIWVQECTGYTPNVNGARVIGTTPSATQFTIDDLNVTETLSPFPGNVYARALGLRAADGSTLNLLTRDITGTWAADQWKANQITLTESGTTLAGVNAAVRPAQSFWSYAMFGLNLRATASGYESVTEGATPGSGFGLMIERDYFVDAPAVATDKYFTHEFYFQDRNNARPFFGAQSEAVEATVTQTGTATVTISASQTEAWARLGDGTVAAGMRFRFTQLSGASGVNTTTWYYVLTSPSATTFTYSDSPGGAAIVATFSATSTATRGGWGNFALNVPTAINVGTGFGTASNYNTSTVPVPIFSAISNVAGRDGYIKFDNLSALDSSFFIDFSTANTARRRMGINTLGSNNPRDFCIQDATTGAMDFQLQAGGSIALGYAAYHAAASTLDVNGTVTATAFSGSGAGLTAVNAATAALADDLTDASSYITFSLAATGSNALKTTGSLRWNPVSQIMLIGAAQVSVLTDITGGARAGSFTTLAASGAISSTFNQTQSTAQARFSGTLLGSGTGASATNSWPAIYHAPSSITAPTNWSTGANNGTVYGAVEVAGFTGNFLDLKISGTSASKLIITSAGSITMDVNGSGTYTSGGGVSSGFRWSSRGNMGAYLDGKFQLQNNTAGAGVLFDVTTDGTIKIRTRADGADGSLTALNITASGTLAVTGISTFTGGSKLGATVVGSLPAAGSNTYLELIVTDSLAPVVGSTVAAGGSAKAKVCSNGTNWIVTAPL